MNYLQNTPDRIGKSGMGLLGLFFIFILIIFLLFLGDMAFIFISEECIDLDFIACAFAIAQSEDEEPAEGSVTATGVISGEYGGENRSVTVTLTFGLEGGEVSGGFSGDCDGNIKGTYAGGNGGAISGKAKGSCGFVIPASGQFTGTVNQSNKTVPVTGSGSAAGFSGEGSLTLTY